ncbi:unnamed protein product, partial [marine sediment metagenome]
LKIKKGQSKYAEKAQGAHFWDVDGNEYTDKDIFG